MLSFTQWSVDCIISKRMACARIHSINITTTTKYPATAAPPPTIQYCKISVHFALLRILFLPLSPLLVCVCLCLCLVVFTFLYFNFNFTEDFQIFQQSYSFILFKHHFFSICTNKLNESSNPIDNRQMHLLHLGLLHGTAIRFIFSCFIVQCWSSTCTRFIFTPSNFKRTIMVVNCSNRSWCSVVVDCRKRKEEEEYKPKKYS